MAIYHLEAKVVSRGAGRSAVAASAYLSCSRLYNDYDGIQHDYTRKQGLVWQQVFLPEYAPQEWKDREQLWNAVAVHIFYSEHTVYFPDPLCCARSMAELFF